MSSLALSGSLPNTASPARRSVPLWLVPSFSDCFFLAVLIWLFVAGASGWKALLMDGDTGWHIRTGEYIFDNGRIPAHDLFSFSKPGAPWFAWEWLADLLFGVLFRLGGLKGIVLYAGVLIALYSTVVLRFSLWRGANVMLALPLTLLAVGSSTIHFLARPHLFTLLLFPAALWMLEADRRTPSNRVWALIPITALWTNLHGGFVLFLACLGLLVVGAALETHWSQVRRYTLLFIGCSLATVLNPFGIGLHRHILEYLRADWIRNLVQEFQAPAFRSEGQMHFEILLLAGVMIAARLAARRRWVEVLWTVFLAHSALTSVRHAPLFSAAVAPLIAAELSSLWDRRTALAPRASLTRIFHQVGSDLKPAFRRTSGWPCVAIVLLACIGAPIVWPRDFPSEAFPTAMVHRNRATLLAGRTLTTDQWGDYLIYSFYPQQKVFIDGRSDFYGEQFARDYLILLQAGSSAGTILKRYAFDCVLIPVDWPLATMLKRDAAWKIIEDDEHAILFVPAAHKALLQRPGSAE